MIHFVERENLNLERYDACIASALQSNLFGFSWYLDICCDNWAVIVLNDYEAVMPLPFRKKYGIKYVHPPLWVLQLGLYSNDERVQIAPFLKLVKDQFKFVELRLNTRNFIGNRVNGMSNCFMQYVSLKEGYDRVSMKYNRNRKRELIKANTANLIEKWTDSPEKLVALYKENIAGRLSKITERDFENLLAILKRCLSNKTGELLTVSSEDNTLISAAFFIKHNNTVTQVVCASDMKNRDNGANTFSNDRAIFRFQKKFDVYNFGGSSITSIAKYYKSFGAETETYQFLKYNNLFSLFKLFKR